MRTARAWALESTRGGRGRPALHPWDFANSRGHGPPREFPLRGERLRGVPYEPRPWSAEQNLRAAVLEQAVELILKPGCGKGRRLARLEALDWIRSADRRGPFAFENVCDALNLNPELVRRAVLR